MLVGRVIVHDDMQRECGRGLDINLVEKTDELLMPMARHAVANYLAVEHAEGREQGGRAVALVVVRHRPTAAPLQGKTGLGAIEGLDLTFLVDAQHERPVRGIEIQADNIVELLNELLVPTDFEGLDEMGLETVSIPDASNRRFAKTLGLGHAPRAPVGGGMGCGVQRGRNDCLDFAFRDGWDTTRTRGVLFQSRQSEGQKTFPPELHGRPGDFQILRDVQAGHSVRRHLDDPGPLDQAQREAPSACPCAQGGSLLNGQKDFGRGCHAHSIAYVEGGCQVIYDALH